MLDFVAAWYVKAAKYIKAAGDGASRAVLLFRPIRSPKVNKLAFYGVGCWRKAFIFNFAHRTFSWSNEASGKAAVHCVIIGFGLEDRPNKVIFEYEDIKGEPHAISCKQHQSIFGRCTRMWLLTNAVIAHLRRS